MFTNSKFTLFFFSNFSRRALPAGMTSLPIPSPGINPIFNEFCASLELERPRQKSFCIVREFSFFLEQHGSEFFNELSSKSQIPCDEKTVHYISFLIALHHLIKKYLQYKHDKHIIISRSIIRAQPRLLLFFQIF